MLQKFNEFNKKDKWFVTNEVSDQFTIGVEYELCANEDPDDEPPVEDYGKALKHVKEKTILAIERKGSYGVQFNMTPKEYKEFIDDILGQVLDAYYDDNEDIIYEEILNPQYYEDDYTKSFIIDTLAGNVMRFVDSQNIDYLIGRVKEKLPNFYKKWNRTLKYELEGDNEKQRIIEFSPKTYVDGLNKGIEQLNDFFNEFEKQDYWYFNNRTALHLNIGVKSKKIKLNPLKGLILLADFNRNERTPFLFKGIEHRLPNIHVGSMIDKLKELITDTLNREEHLDKRDYEKLDKYKEYLSGNVDKLDLHKLEELEEFMNDLLVRTNVDFWVKEFGLNITQYKKGYVEFRFVGGDVKRDLVLDKLIYFSYITWAMADPEYKRREYTRGLYKLIGDLKSVL